MKAKILAALVACLSAWATPLLAQGKQLGSEAEPAFVVVEGLAPSDLLNVRATASPTGLLMDRLQNGTMLKSFGCMPVNGYDWCRVEGVNDPGIKGWTPARYLLASAEEPDTAPPTPAAETATSTPALPPAETAGRGTAPTNMDAALAGAVQAVGETAAALAAGRPVETPRPPEPVGQAATVATVSDDAVVRPAAAAAPRTPAPAAASGASEGAAEIPAAPPAAPASTPSPAQETAQPTAPSTPEATPAAASAVAAHEVAAPQPALTIFSPAILVLFGFPAVFMPAMAAIASFGTFAFASPLEESGIAF